MSIYIIYYASPIRLGQTIGLPQEVYLCRLITFNIFSSLRVHDTILLFTFPVPVSIIPSPLYNILVVPFLNTGVPLSKNPII